MKDIKFRAYDTITEYMFIQGTPDLETIQSFFFHIPTNAKLMQYTGLKDKNGKEIYEGDIVEFKYLGWHKSEVKYLDSGFYVTNNGHTDEVLENLKLSFPFSSIEVIGNIYENGGLLK